MHAVPHSSRRSRHAGFSLIEVMVAVLVLSVGLLGLARLQLELVRGAADSRARTAAVALAEEKLEDLRSYAVVSGDLAPCSISTGVSPQAWSYICDNTGGRIGPQTRELEGVNYALSWTASTVTYIGPAPGLPTDYKDVTVTVAWEDSDPNTPTQQVQLTGSIMGIPPGNVIAASEPLVIRPPGPDVLYTPGEAPEIISVPIDVGDGKKRETTKPLPDVQARGDYSHEVRFDVVNYQNIGGENILLRREEFISVNCRCELVSGGQSRTPARVKFENGVLADQAGAPVTKSLTGVASETGPDGVSAQPPTCALCCRDHHDGPVIGSDNNRFVPTASSDHAHFLRETDGTYTAATSAGAPYDEACRLKRVNGVFQVYEDWNLNTIMAIPSTDLEDGDATQTAYVDYIQDYVANAVDPSEPAATAPTFSTTSLQPGGSAQLLGRGIYLDHMPDNLVQYLTDSTNGLIPNGQPFLEFVPFFEINLTKLADWKLQDASTTTDYATVSGQNCHGSTSQATLAGYVACISNQTIVDEGISQNNYSRGLIKAGPVTGSKDAQVYARAGNTGMTSTFALTAASDVATPVFDEYNFSVDAGQAISGTVLKGNASSGAGGLPWTAVTCAYAGALASGTCALTGTGNSRSFNVNVPTGWSGTISVTYAGGVCPAGTVSRTAPSSGNCFKLDNNNSCTGTDLVCP